MHRVTLQQSLPGGAIVCDTCAHHCVIEPGEVGRCGVRRNEGGVLYSLVYGRMASSHIDPVEKKPLFHFLPGARTFSVSTVGCNLRCRHCQNASISQMPVDEGRITGTPISPEAVVASASSERCRIMAYTYTEPAIYWDYARDMAELAAGAGLKNIFVSNGYWSPAGVKGMLPFMDAANIDLKSFSDAVYHDLCGARLKPVQACIETLREAGVWVEVTTLIIPGINDSPEELRDMARWLASVDAAMPWHVSAFYPTYRLTDRPPTPAHTLLTARDIGLNAGLKFVYVGNLRDADALATHCPNCRALLVSRLGFAVGENRIRSGACPECGSEVAGVWE